jgi:hypothetical protein
MDDKFDISARALSIVCQLTRRLSFVSRSSRLVRKNCSVGQWASNIPASYQIVLHASRVVKVDSISTKSYAAVSVPDSLISRSEYVRLFRANRAKSSRGWYIYWHYAHVIVSSISIPVHQVPASKMTTLYQQSIPVLVKYLKNLSFMLQKGAKFCDDKEMKHEDLLTYRLISDMRG